MSLSLLIVSKRICRRSRYVLAQKHRTGFNAIVEPVQAALVSCVQLSGAWQGCRCHADVGQVLSNLEQGDAVVL